MDKNKLTTFIDDFSLTLDLRVDAYVEDGKMIDVTVYACSSMDIYDITNLVGSLDMNEINELLHDQYREKDNT